MPIAPRYPRAVWECGVCGKRNPGDIGECTNMTCRGGTLIREGPRPAGGLEHGSIPYFPVWHAKKAGHDVHDGLLPVPDKYPHHKRRVRV